MCKWIYCVAALFDCGSSLCLVVKMLVKVFLCFNFQLFCLCLLLLVPRMRNVLISFNININYYEFLFISFIFFFFSMFRCHFKSMLLFFSLFSLAHTSTVAIKFYSFSLHTSAPHWSRSSSRAFGIPVCFFVEFYGFFVLCGKNSVHVIRNEIYAISTRWDDCLNGINHKPCA